MPKLERGLRATHPKGVVVWGGGSKNINTRDDAGGSHVVGALAIVTDTAAMDEEINIARVERMLEMAASERAELNTQIETLLESRQSYEQLAAMLRELPNKIESQILVPFGPLAFFNGSLQHTNEVTVNLGENYYAKCSAVQAAKIADDRAERTKPNAAAAQAEVDALSERIEQLLALGEHVGGMRPGEIEIRETLDGKPLPPERGAGGGPAAGKMSEASPKPKPSRSLPEIRERGSPSSISKPATPSASSSSGGARSTNDVGAQRRQAAKVTTPFGGQIAPSQESGRKTMPPLPPPPVQERAGTAGASSATNRVSFGDAQVVETRERPPALPPGADTGAPRQSRFMASRR